MRLTEDEPHDPRLRLDPDAGDDEPYGARDESLERPAASQDGHHAQPPERDDEDDGDCIV